MPKKTVTKDNLTLYKNKPLVRCGNVIFYGNINEKYVIKLEILSSKSIFNMEIADKVSVKLISTDTLFGSRKRAIKKCEKVGLYAALDIAEAWLSKALEED